MLGTAQRRLAVGLLGIQIVVGGGHGPALHGQAVGRAPAFQAGGAGHVLHAGGAALNQLADFVVKVQQLGAVRAVVPLQANFVVLALLGHQIGVAAPGHARRGVVQIVERWGAHALAMRGVGTPARRQLQAIAQAIGGKAAKLRVIVPAHIGLPRVATGAAIHADKSGIDRAPIDRVVVRGVHLLLQALPPGQHRAHGGGQLVVPLEFGLAGVQVAVAPGGLPIHELVGRFTDRHGARPDWQKFAFEREPAHFGAHVGVRILGAGAIIHPGFALRLQPLPFDAPVGIQSVAQRHLGGGLLQAIAVGVVAEHILGIGR